MKNNQFRAYLDKYVKKKYEYTTVLTVDLDSNRREKGRFNYCELKQAIELIDKAIKYFAEGGRYE